MQRSKPGLPGQQRCRIVILKQMTLAHDRDLVISIDEVQSVHDCHDSTMLEFGVDDFLHQAFGFAVDTGD